MYQMFRLLPALSIRLWYDDDHEYMYQYCTLYSISLFISPVVWLHK